ncbi:MAG TPA: hypothetical protein VLF66_16595, partial [Thermoanaerobaculia bacterium]|nr:hypothetical protein [Thermoanaerobaculia bacterium]
MSIFAVLFAALHGLSAAASDSALAAPADAQPEVVFEDSGADDPERLRAERRAQAHDLDFFAPYYSVEGGRDTTLFLMNTISDPISVAVSALADDGAELALGSYVIESLQHVEISLRERLRGFEEDFAMGSLRLSLLGDVDTLQGWAVITEPDGQTFEIALITPEEATARELVAYWDTTIPAVQGAGGAIFHLVNTSDRAIDVELVAGLGSRTNTSVLEISPRGRARVERVGEAPLGPRGWLEIRHGGEAGDLVAVGLAGRGRHSVSLPLVPRTDTETNDRHESMPSANHHQVQGLDGAPVWLTLFNPAGEDRIVKIEALDAETGSTVGQAQLRPGSKEVLSVPLQRLIPATRAASHGVRVRVRSEDGGVLVRGFTAQPDGTVTDLAFFSYGVHPNGTYPLPDPTRYETVTTVVNLGYKPSRIAGQV